MQCDKILLPVVVPSETRGNIELAVRLLPAHGKLVALKVIRVPEATSLSEGAAEAVDSRATLDETHAILPDPRVELKTLVRVSHHLSEGISETVAAENADLLILPWKGSASSEAALFGRTIDRFVKLLLVICWSPASGSWRIAKKSYSPCAAAPTRNLPCRSRIG